MEERIEKYNKLLNEYADELSEHVRPFLLSQITNAEFKGQVELEAQFESMICYFGGMLTSTLKIRSKEYRLKVLDNITSRVLQEDA